MRQKKAFGDLTKWIYWIPCLALLKSNSQMTYYRNILIIFQGYSLTYFRILRPLCTYIKGFFFSHLDQFIRNSQFSQNKRDFRERNLERGLERRSLSQLLDWCPHTGLVDYQCQEDRQEDPNILKLGELHSYHWRRRLKSKNKKRRLEVSSSSKKASIQVGVLNFRIGL